MRTSHETLKGVFYISLVLLGIAAFVGVSYSMWIVGRKIHYSFAYESMVRETITEMVKAEALKP